MRNTLQCLTQWLLLKPGSRRGGETRWRHGRASTLLLLLLLARQPLVGEADARGKPHAEDREEAVRRRKTQFTNLAELD